MCWLARRQGYAVELEHGPPPDGTVFSAARRIRIPPGLSGEQAVSGHWRTKRLGHVLLHHDPGYPPGTTTAGCAGLRKAEARHSVAWITCARHGIIPGGLPYPANWPAPTRAPSPPPPSCRRAPHHRSRHPHHRPHQPHPARRPRPGPPLPARTRPSRHRQPPGGHPAHPGPPPATHPNQTGTIRRVLADAHAFYTGQLAGSWAPGYLHARGITAVAIQHWHIGYAPAGWTALTSHLRRLGPP